MRVPHIHEGKTNIFVMSQYTFSRRCTLPTGARCDCTALRNECTHIYARAAVVVVVHLDESDGGKDWRTPERFYRVFACTTDER